MDDYYRNMKQSRQSMSVNRSSALKFRQKYLALKSTARSLVYENAALCDRAAHAQRRVLRAQEERRCLLQKLLQLEAAEAAAAPAAAGRQRRLLLNAVPCDVSGLPRLPLQLGALTLISTGRLLAAHGHTTDALYPVGYTSTRCYLSTAPSTASSTAPSTASAAGPQQQRRQPSALQSAVYTCRVLETGSGSGPTLSFAISCAQWRSDDTIAAATPDQCHARLLQRLTAVGDGQLQRLQLKPAGHTFFGLDHPSVRYLLQQLPSIKHSGDYCPVQFQLTERPLPSPGHDDPAVSLHALCRLLVNNQSSVSSLN